MNREIFLSLRRYEYPHLYKRGMNPIPKRVQMAFKFYLVPLASLLMGCWIQL